MRSQARVYSLRAFCSVDFEVGVVQMHTQTASAGSCCISAWVVSNRAGCAASWRGTLKCRRNRAITHVPTMPIATTSAGTNQGAPANAISTLLMMMAVHIDPIASTLARRGIGIVGSRYLAYGRNSRDSTSRRSSHGQLLVRQNDPISTKTVVGIPGTTTPTAPNPKHVSPAAARAIRRTDVGRGWQQGKTRSDDSCI